MCKKQASVPHSSTESELTSFDAGLRMDGLLALEVSDVVIEVSHLSKSTESLTHGAVGNCSQTHKSRFQKGQTDVDYIICTSLKMTKKRSR